VSFCETSLAVRGRRRITPLRGGGGRHVSTEGGANHSDGKGGGGVRFGKNPGGRGKGGTDGVKAAELERRGRKC